MGDLFITEVVKKLIILNIAIFFIAYYLFPSSVELLALHYPFAQPAVSPDVQAEYDLLNRSSTGFMPMQIVTSMFMHGSANHLIMNMLSLLFLGPYIEIELGKERFLIYYILTGFGATALHLLFEWYDVNYNPVHDEFTKLLISHGSVMGASGAIFGLLAAIGLLMPYVRFSPIFIPIQMPAWVMVAIYLGVEIYHILFHPKPGIAHYAHLGGALCGGILLAVWRRRRID
jgi:membrane associated rhomboid family serine protease